MNTGGRSRTGPPPFGAAGAILAASFLLQWLAQGFSYGMGNGVAPAGMVLTLGAFIGLPAVLVIVAIALRTSRATAVRMGAGALGLTIANTGLICLLAASPMESEFYDYGFVDREPDLAGMAMVLLGAALVVVTVLKSRAGGAS